MLKHILKDLNLTVDGRGYAGRVEELVPPKLTVKTEDVRAGGMDAPVQVDMGMEALTCEFTLVDYDPDVLALFGLAPGATTQLTMRGAVEDEFSGTVRPVVVNVRGRVKELDPGTWKPGEKTTLKATMALTYYKLVHDGRELHEIDVPNMVRRIDGVDQLAARRVYLLLSGRIRPLRRKGK